MTPAFLLWVGFALVFAGVNLWEHRKHPGRWLWWRNGGWSVAILALLGLILYPVHQNALGRVWRRNLVRDMAFSPDSRLLAIRRAGGITIREVATGREVRTFKLSGLPSLFPTVYANEIARTGPRSMAFSADGSRLVIGGWSGITVWDADRGHVLATLRDERALTPVVFATDDQSVVAASGNGRVITLSNPEGQVQSVQVCPPNKRLLDIALRPDWRLVILTESTLEIWNASSWTRVHSVPMNVRTSGMGYQRGWASSHDGRWILIEDHSGGGSESRFHLWDTMYLRRIETVRLPDLGPVAISPDGRFAATARSIEDRVSVGVWEIASGRLVHQKDLEKSPWCLAYSPNGKWLAVGSARGVRVWNTSEEHIPAP